MDNFLFIISRSKKDSRLILNFIAALILLEKRSYIVNRGFSVSSKIIFKVESHVTLKAKNERY